MYWKTPIYIQDAKVLGAPVKFQWDSKIALGLYAAKDQNARLYETIDLLNFKAKMAVGIAITEWIVWRFEGLADLVDARQKITAAWASVIHPGYTKTLYRKMTKVDYTKVEESAVELTLCVLGKADDRFKKGDIYLTEHIVRQAMLARYLMPNKKAFSDWLSETLRLSAQAFPSDVEYDFNTGIYDASHEKPVPREFFDPAFNYTEEAAVEVLRNFLHSLDLTENPYLNSPEEMKKTGFPGAPYTFG